MPSALCCRPLVPLRSHPHTIGNRRGAGDHREVRSHPDEGKPNPFSRSTEIRYALASPTTVKTLGTDAMFDLVELLSVVARHKRPVGPAP